jgi:hypothetical protein
MGRLSGLLLQSGVKLETTGGDSRSPSQDAVQLSRSIDGRGGRLWHSAVDKREWWKGAKTVEEVRALRYRPYGE